MKYKLLWFCLFFLVISCEKYEEEGESISIPIFEIRTSSFPLLEDDEVFFSGPIKRITIKENSNYSDGFSERLRIIDIAENGNILGSKVLVDDIENEVKYLYNDLDQIVDIQYFKNQNQIDSHKYTYESINESNIFVNGYSQAEDKTIYPERIFFNSENSIIISKVKDGSTEVIYTYKYEKKRIVSVEQNSEFFKLRRAIQYSENGRPIKQYYYRREDLLYQTEFYIYSNNGNLIKITVEDNIKEKIKSERVFSNFDTYGNWQKLEVVKKEQTILVVKRLFEYF